MVKGNKELVALQAAVAGARDGGDPAAYLATVSVPDAAAVLRRLQGFAQAVGYPVQMLAAVEGLGDGNIPMAETNQKTKVISLTASARADANVYLLSHELGHALGTFSPVRVGLTPEEQTLLHFGLIGRSDLPVFVRGEGEAEVVASLVMAHFGQAPNVAYFRNWNVTARVITTVGASAAKVAARIVGAAAGAAPLTKAA